MIMTHVDLIEKVCRAAFPLPLPHRLCVSDAVLYEQLLNYNGKPALSWELHAPNPTCAPST